MDTLFIYHRSLGAYTFGDLLLIVAFLFRKLDLTMPFLSGKLFLLIFKFLKTMRQSLMIVAFALLTFVVCNNNKSTENHEHNADGKATLQRGTHTHDDGSVHNDHAEEVKQETFKAGQDSTKVEHKNETEHGHDHSDPNHKNINF